MSGVLLFLLSFLISPLFVQHMFYRCSHIWAGPGVLERKMGFDDIEGSDGAALLRH